MEVPEGEYTVTLVPGYASGLSSATVGPVAASSLVNRTLPLPARSELRGSVTDPDGDPVEGARVVTQSLGPSGYTWLAVTDAAGQFLQAADVGDVELTVLPPDGASLASPERHAWTNQDGQPPVSLALEAAVRVSGRVTYHSAGVGDVRVEIADPETGGILCSGLTNVDGYYECRLSEAWVLAR